MAYRAFSDVAGKGAFFLVTVFAARRLSQHGFGIFSLGTTIGWMAAVATDFGIQLHLARAVAQHPEDAPGLLHTWWRVRLTTSAVACTAVSVGLLMLRADRSSSVAILLLVLVYIVGGLVEFLHYFYRGLSRSDLESTLTLWQRFGMLAAGVAALVWRPEVTLLGFAMLIPVAATLVSSLRLAARMAREQRAAAPMVEHGWATPRAELTRVAPIGIGIVLSALYFRLDVFLIEIWRGTEAVALYNAVFRLVDALRLFPAAVLAVALPALFRATNARPLLGVSAVVTAFSVVVTIVLWAAAGWLVPVLYGEAYGGAVTAFRILLTALPLMSLNYALTHQLLGWNLHRAYAAICAAALVFNLLLNARLIPALSIAGAAWATLATEALLTVGCVAVLRASRSGAEPMTATVVP